MEVRRKTYLKEPEPITIILLDLNFTWPNKQIIKCKELWNQGYEICEIVKMLGVNGKHKEFEVFSLLYHMADKNLITKREGYIWGNRG